MARAAFGPEARPEPVADDVRGRHAALRAEPRLAISDAGDSKRPRPSETVGPD